MTDNNFNLVRLYLSLSVLFFHAFELSRNQALSFLNVLFSADKAVDAFFIISGYLIMKSFLRSGTAGEYFIKRARRIYPAYFLVIILCTVLGFLVSHLDAPVYFKSPSTYKYLFFNALFLNFAHPGLPGVFDNNFFHAVNGSLWTLKVELSYYLLVPLIAWLRHKVRPVLLYSGLFLLSASYYYLMLTLYNTRHQDIFLFLSRQIPGELMYFILGAVVVELEDRPLFRKALGWLGIPALLALFLPSGLLVQVIPGSLAIAVVVFFFAFRLPVLRYPFRKEDISYGLYIYHFPVIQVLIALGVYDRSAVLGLIVSLLLTVILALLSWFLIEKPFIRKRSPLSLSSFYIPGHNRQ